MSAIDPSAILGALDRRLSTGPADAARLALADECRASLARFIFHGWHVLEPTTPLTWNWHIDAIADHVQAALEGWGRKQADPDAATPFQNLLINVPPGTAKSRIVSVFSPAWAWLRWPAWRGIFLSSNPRVALRDSIYCRDLIESRWYRDTFRPPWGFSADQNAKGLYRNSAGGFRQAMGFGARITGDRADGIFWDDPHDAEEVLSEVSRTAVTDRWNDAIGNRLNDLRCSIRVGVMQRLHEADLSGVVLAQGGWEHLCIPQEFEPDRRHVTAIGWTDPRTEDGELLFPERFPAKVLAEEKARLGVYGFAGQHQQRPAPREGGMFQLRWFEVVDAAPAMPGVARVRYWDFASTLKGDYTVGARLARTPDGLYVVEDVVRGRWTPHERDAVVLQTARMDGIGVRIVIEQEPGSAGVSVIASMVRMLAGFAIEGERATGDKATRAGPFASQMQAGNVRLVRGEWNRQYIDELCSFPSAAHDDCVDASSGAFNKLALIGPPRRSASASIPAPPPKPLPVGY